jgi:GT2 family glycosyltransferase
VGDSASALLPRSVPPPAPGVPLPATALSASFVARWVTEVDLGEALRDVVAPPRPDGTLYARARVLIRLHREPLGTLELPLLHGRLPVRRLVAAVRGELEGALGERGVEAAMVTAAGLPGLAPVRSTEPERLPLVSVIVATRERPASLEVCLRTLCALDYPSFEVLVVDNAPATRVTAELVRRLEDPRIRYLVEPRPGASRARNLGAREAAGEILAFTDDDVLADSQWLRGLVRGFQRAAGVTCVTGLVPSAELETEHQLLFDSRVTWGTSCERRLYDLVENRHIDSLYPYIPGALGTGANFALTREAFGGLGGFDEALGPGRPALGGEDLDLFVRVLLAGHRVAYEPSGLVWHVHRRDERELRRQLFGYGTGLAAYAFKRMISPSTALDVLRRVPRALRRVRVGPKVSDRQRVPLPGRLLAVELLGLVLGPAAYLRGRLPGR